MFDQIRFLLKALEIVTMLSLHLDPERPYRVIESGDQTLVIQPDEEGTWPMVWNGIIAGPGPYGVHHI